VEAASSAIAAVVGLEREAARETLWDAERDKENVACLDRVVEMDLRDLGRREGKRSGVSARVSRLAETPIGGDLRPDLSTFSKPRFSACPYSRHM
jgi:hypothetical protein